MGHQRLSQPVLVDGGLEGLNIRHALFRLVGRTNCAFPAVLVSCPNFIKSEMGGLDGVGTVGHGIRGLSSQIRVEWRAHYRHHLDQLIS